MLGAFEKKDSLWIVLKAFFKLFPDETIIINDGYPLYRQRESGPSGEKIATSIKGDRELTIDNSNVVPYNYYFLRKYGGHINTSRFAFR